MTNSTFTRRAALNTARRLVVKERCLLQQRAPACLAAGAYLAPRGAEKNSYPFYAAGCIARSRTFLTFKRMIGVITSYLSHSRNPRLS